MVDDRRDEQRFADQLDCDLVRLIMRAENKGGKHWNEVARKLSTARSLIRDKMHPKDRASTW